MKNKSPTNWVFLVICIAGILLNIAYAVLTNRESEDYVLWGSYMAHVGNTRIEGWSTLTFSESHQGCLQDKKAFEQVDPRIKLLCKKAEKTK